MPQSLSGPGGSLVGMASRAGIRDRVLVGPSGSDKGEGVCSHLHVRNGRFDFRHMTGNAAASGGPFLVMGMLFDCSCPWAIQRKWTMAIHTQLIRRLSQLRVVAGAVRIMAAEAGHSAAIHHALYKIVSLHPVLVGRAVGVMRECRLAERVLLQLPEILKV